MSTVSEHYESKYDSDGKNISKICCMYCPSVILTSGSATHHSHEFQLPFMHPGKGDDSDKVEKIDHYWRVEDMFSFENISVTKTVDKVKYLACADCEIGPIGYMDISTSKSYVALSRVMYKE